MKHPSLSGQPSNEKKSRDRRSSVLDASERLIQYIEDTEYDREVLPHYGLIPDWYHSV